MRTLYRSVLRGSFLHPPPPRLMTEISPLGIKGLGPLSSPSPNRHLSRKLSFELRRQTFSCSPSRRVSVATTTTSKVPAHLPPTSHRPPPCVPCRGHEAVGLSVRSPYQVVHSWQEQAHPLHKLLRPRGGWCVTVLTLQGEACFHRFHAPQTSPSGSRGLAVQGMARGRWAIACADAVWCVCAKLYINIPV